MSSRLVLIASIALISAGALAQRPAPNAFIDHRCSTVPELVAEVRNNPDVMDRFSRHFAMSHEDVVRYVSSLHVSRLRRTGVYTVYSIPPSGYVKMHAEKLERGAPVFADMNDTPILMVKCGNPLTLGPVQPTALAIVPAAQPIAPLREETIVGEVVPAPPVFLAPVPAAPELTPVVTQAPVVGGAIFPWPLLLLPLGFIHGGGGGGGAPVPEPTSLLVFGVGAAALIARKKLVKH